MYLRNIFLWLLFLSCISAYGQNAQTLRIQVNKNKTFNLSEITEQVLPVGLEMNQAQPFDQISDVLWTDKFLFVSVNSIDLVLNRGLPTRVLQYDHSGKFIREIGEQDKNIRKLMCDTLKNLLFIPKGKTVYCYDFDGILKDTYPLKATPSFYCNGYFWIHYMASQQNELQDSLVRYDLQTRKEDILIEYVGHLVKLENASAGRPANFSFYGRAPVVSFGFDNMLHQIDGNKLNPIVKFTIEPELSTLEMLFSQFQGFIGDYLCIHYWNTKENNLYIKNMSTGQVFQTKYSYSREGILTGGIKDDMFATGFCNITPLNRSGYFYFIKKKEELSGNPNITNKSATFTIFLVHLKS